MTVKELEDAINKAEDDMRCNISMHDSYMHIGFLDQASKLRYRMQEQHGNIVKLKERYKKAVQGIKC